MQEIIIMILLVVLIIFAVYKTVKKLRKGGGCCGEHEAGIKSVTVKDRNKSHYPYSADLKITGMTCENCARRVQNVLNSLDGVWADVDIGSGSAHIRMKQETDIKLLCGIIAKAGYKAEPR